MNNEGGQVNYNTQDGDRRLTYVDDPGKFKPEVVDALIEAGVKKVHVSIGPGSGKTRTVFGLLDDMRRKGIPFEIAAGPDEEPLPPTPQPPLNAEFLLHLFLKREEQEIVVGDLIERYPKKVERLGERRAKFWFWGEVLRSLWPLIKRAFLKTSGLVVIGEWIRRHIS